MGSSCIRDSSFVPAIPRLSSPIPAEWVELMGFSDVFSGEKHRKMEKLRPFSASSPLSGQVSLWEGVADG